MHFDNIQPATVLSFSSSSVPHFCFWAEGSFNPWSSGILKSPLSNLQGKALPVFWKWTQESKGFYFLLLSAMQGELNDSKRKFWVSGRNLSVWCPQHILVHFVLFSGMGAVVVFILSLFLEKVKHRELTSVAKGERPVLMHHVIYLCYPEAWPTVQTCSPLSSHHTIWSKGIFILTVLVV